MYQSFYNLKTIPFRSSLDPDFLWIDKHYHKSLDILKYILNNKGCVGLFMGETGSGKTTITQTLLRSLEPEVIGIILLDSSLSVQDFYDFIGHEFGFHGPIGDRKTFHTHICTLLHRIKKENRKVLLALDESQRISDELMDELKSLMILVDSDQLLLSLCLIGELERDIYMMDRIGLSFADNILIRYTFTPYTLKETSQYIQHRLRAAGADRDIFTDNAVKEIHKLAGGYTGRINNISDLALFYGYNERKNEIDTTVVRSCIKKIQFPGESQGGILPLVTHPGTDSDEDGDTPSLKKEEKNSFHSWSTEPPEGKRDAGGMENSKTPPDKPVSEKEIASRSFVMPLLILILAGMLISGGLFYFWKNQETFESLPVLITGEDPVAGEVTETPEQHFSPPESQAAPVPVEGNDNSQPYNRKCRLDPPTV